MNLSSKISELSPHHLYLFYLGESFAPTPSLPDYSKLMLDVLQFAYRLRWAWYWHQNPPKSKPIEENPKLQAIKSVQEKLVLKSDTKSIQFCNNPCLEFYIQQVSKSLLQTNSRRHSLLQDNLPHESRKALQEMKKWREIVIRPADKRF